MKKQKTEQKCKIIKEFATSESILSGTVANLTICKNGVVKIRK